jgi:hypothetical protein
MQPVNTSLQKLMGLKKAAWIEKNSAKENEIMKLREAQKQPK